MAARILVIEDMPTNLKLLRVLLEAFGHHVEVALDGESGLAAARDAAPDLVLCDLHMEGMDGFDVARAIRADEGLQDLPLIAVTALVMAGIKERVFAAGFDAYVSKPIEPRTFIPTIEAFLPADLRSGGQPAG